MVKRLEEGTGKHLRSLDPSGKTKVLSTLAKSVDALMDKLAFFFGEFIPQYDEALELIDVLRDGAADDSPKTLTPGGGTDYGQAAEQLHALAEDLKGKLRSWQPAQVHAALSVLTLIGEKLEPVYQHLDCAIEYGQALGPELAELIGGNADISVGGMEVLMEDTKDKAGATLKLVERAYAKFLPGSPVGQTSPGGTPTRAMTGEEPTRFMPDGSSLPPTVRFEK
ncbi:MULTISPECIES: hypothetical protein [Streptomyces]|uniref:hypothetical protein n=1 Tax=Streptomyces TaxID=1883 RepID=UPI00403D2149